MSRLWPLARRYGFDVLVGLAALVCALEVALAQHGPRAPQTSHWFAVPAAAAIVLPLLWRRRYPFAAPAALWVVAVAVSFADGRLVVSTQGLFVVGFVAAFLLGKLDDPRRGRAGLALVLAGAAAVVLGDPDHAAGELLFTPLSFAIAWLVGFAFQERAAQAEAAEERASQAERERETAARLAVAEERARIARELHDIVAHSVAVMVLQVGAVRHRLPGGAADDRDALEEVERTGRSALAEMRRLLGAMRHDSEAPELAPQPGLGSLEPLLAEVRRSGLAVELHVDGEPVPLPGALDLSAYRIVQEGLTNALKHAGARRADVVLRYRPGELRIDVRDDGAGPASSDGLGHGLVGIRERVTLFGGEMSAGAANGRGFLLTTRLPIETGLR